MTVAVVIPALNEAATIASVVARAKAFGTVIVVDDGSSDHTAACAAAVGATVVSHQRNAGYDGALQSGFVAASSIGAEIVVTLDADGQHDPDMLLQALKPIHDGRVDLVIGQRDVLPPVAEIDTVVGSSPVKTAILPPPPPPDLYDEDPAALPPLAEIAASP